MRFKIGDRVKLVNAVRNLASNGKTGVIQDLVYYEKGSLARGGEYRSIDTDCVVIWDDGTENTCAFWQLEPIQPKYDGNTMTEWDELTNLLGCDIRDFVPQRDKERVASSSLY